MQRSARENEGLPASRSRRRRLDHRGHPKTVHQLQVARIGPGFNKNSKPSPKTGGGGVGLDDPHFTIDQFLINVLFGVGVITGSIYGYALNSCKIAHGWGDIEINLKYLHNVGSNS